MKTAGSVPNTFTAIGALRSAALKAVLDAEAVLKKGTLDRKDQETIKLTVSEGTGCDYCAAAHSALGKQAGLKSDATHRRGLLSDCHTTPVAPAYQ